MKKIVLLFLVAMLLSGCDPYMPTLSTAVPTPGTMAATAHPTQAATPSTAPTETQPHIHSYFGEVVAPNCTEGGYTVHTCACGDSFTDSVTDALGHAWGQWQTVEPANIEKEGLQRRECARCDAYETQMLPKLEPEHTHVYSDTVVASTCTEVGYTYHVCTCGDSYRDAEVDPLGHSFSEYKSNGDATCTSDGTKTAVCDRCAAVSTVGDVGSALGHNWGQWATTKEPTTDTEGLQTRACTRCSATDIQTIDKLPQQHTHAYKKKRVAATCTEGSYTLYTCQCGDSYREETSQPNGHTWGEWVVEIGPTTTAQGQLSRSCTICEAKEHSATDPLPSETGFIVVVQPGTVGRNQKATVAIIGQAGVTYDIDVYYKSGESSAKGLEDKTADEDGYVSWTWKVGASTAAGTYRIVISGAGETQTIYFTVEV